MYKVTVVHPDGKVREWTVSKFSKAIGLVKTLEFQMVGTTISIVCIQAELDLGGKKK